MMLLRDVNGNRTPENVQARRNDIRYYRPHDIGDAFSRDEQ